MDMNINRTRFVGARVVLKTDLNLFTQGVSCTTLNLVSYLDRYGGMST